MPDRQTIQLHVGGKTLTVYPSYIYCNVCGRTPDAEDEPNYAPIQWWDPDEGWKIGTLCRSCAREAVARKPQPDDWASLHAEELGAWSIDDSGTDEDPTLALYGYAFEE